MVLLDQVDNLGIKSCIPSSCRDFSAWQWRFGNWVAWMDEDGQRFEDARRSLQNEMWKSEKSMKSLVVFVKRTGKVWSMTGLPG